MSIADLCIRTTIYNQETRRHIAIAYKRWRTYTVRRSPIQPSLNTRSHFLPGHSASYTFHNNIVSQRTVEHVVLFCKINFQVVLQLQDASFTLLCVGDGSEIYRLFDGAILSVYQFCQQFLLSRCPTKLLSVQSLTFQVDMSKDGLDSRRFRLVVWFRPLVLVRAVSPFWIPMVLIPALYQHTRK